MEDNLLLQNCCEDDALSFKSGMFKAGRVRQAVESAFKGTVADSLYESLNSQGVNIEPGPSQNGRSRLSSKWFDEGIDCEVLKLSAKCWQKGKARIKVSLEFFPDELEIIETPEVHEQGKEQTESTLDDVRRITTKSTQ